VNFWLDCLLLALFMLLLWSATVVQFVFPDGPNAAGWSLWGRGHTEWARFQFGVVCAFVLAVLVHVMLHWSWVCGVVASHLARRSGDKKPPSMF